MLYIIQSICYYLRNLFKFCLGPCNHACFYPRLARRLDSLHILSFACQRSPSRGFSTSRLLLLFVSCQDWHVWLLPVTMLFYRVYFNTLDIFLGWILSHVRSGQSLEGSALFLRVLFFWVSDVFEGGSEVVSESFYCDSKNFRKGTPEVSEKLLAVSV